MSICHLTVGVRCGDSERLADLPRVTQQVSRQNTSRVRGLLSPRMPPEPSDCAPNLGEELWRRGGVASCQYLPATENVLEISPDPSESRLQKGTLFLLGRKRKVT